MENETLQNGFICYLRERRKRVNTSPVIAIMADVLLRNLNNNLLFHSLGEIQILSIYE